MPGRKLDVLVLFDVPYTPPNHLAWHEFMVGDEWKDERDVIKALMRLGHRASAFGLTSSRMVFMETPPHFATPDQPWMQKCCVICS